MNHFDVDAALKTMTILCDTREQDTPQLRRRLEGLQCPFSRAKLEFGDYSAQCVLPGGTIYSLSDKLAIERKMNATELCGNVAHERARFERELERARSTGAELILMVENATWATLYAGQYRSKLNPKALTATIHAYEERYGIRPHFIPSELSGQFIRDKLYYGLRERLLNLEDGGT